MGKVNCTFERIEKKYMLDDAQYEQLMPVINEHMQLDEYGRHTIANIYYDTDDFSLIRESIEKPKYKEKLRLRSYGVPRADSTVFVELKKKVGGVVYKRRVSMKLNSAYAFLSGDFSLDESQIGRELAWFISSHEVSPKVMLAYERQAYFGRENAELRLTVDENIRFRSEGVDLKNGAWGIPLQRASEHLIEVKIPGAMPVWMAEAFSRLSIFPTSFSKYGTCYKERLCNKLNIGGVSIA